VFEYAEHDLQGILEKGIEFSKSQFKSILKQLLEGLAYLHDSGVMHRDIKGGNILLTKGGIVKLADFGLARSFNKENAAKFTVMVVTRWYRAPELLLGNSQYSSLIDIWSVGCLIAEMILGRPLLAGRTDLE
jgi:cyclin-dependent kinase 12/13